MSTTTNSLQKEDWIRLILAATQRPALVLSVFRERLTEDAEVVLADHMRSAPPEVIQQHIIPAIRDVVANSQPDNSPALTTALYLASYVGDALTRENLLQIAFGDFPTVNRRQAVALLPLRDEKWINSVLRQLGERNDRQIAEVFWGSWSRRSPDLAQRVDRMFGFSPGPSTVVAAAPRLIDRILDRAISFLWRLNLVGDAGLTVAFGPDDAPASSETKLSVTPNEDVLTATFSAKEYDDRDFPAGAVLVEAIDPVAEGERVVAHRLMRIQPIPDSKQFSGKVDLLEWKESPHNQLPREFRGPYRASLLADSNQQRLKGIPLTEIQRYEKMISHIPNLVQELHELTASLDAPLTH